MLYLLLEWSGALTAVRESCSARCLANTSATTFRTLVRETVPLRRVVLFTIVLVVAMGLKLKGKNDLFLGKWGESVGGCKSFLWGNKGWVDFGIWVDDGGSNDSYRPGWVWRKASAFSAWPVPLRAEM
jgi:hypothetical protein